MMHRTRRRNGWLWFVMLLVALVVAGAFALEWWPGKDLGVRDVQTRATGLDGDTVTVRGVVAMSGGGSLLGGGIYVLHNAESGQASVTVVTTSELPRVGDVLRIRARVRNALVVNGRSFGTVLEEQRRLPDPVGWLHYIVPPW